MAVTTFFVISGYLIAGSFEGRSPSKFLIARALRIMPGLLFVLLFLSLVFGPLISNLSVTQYFSSMTLYKNLATNISLTDFIGNLPGVFVNNPYQDCDGSLWTLRYEAECYMLIFALGTSKLLNRFTVSGLLLCALLLSWKWIGGYRVSFYSDFLGGAAFYYWKPPLRLSMAVAATFLLSLSLYSGYRLAAATVGAYLILYIGLCPLIRLPKVTRWGDLSYGTYIWAWPVQQTLVMTAGAWLQWYTNVLLALPLTLTLALLSWRYIEGPSLQLKSRSRNSQATPATLV
jgi:peptidoglycan/LPS O-acetylase OafA/YrhL